MNGVVRVHITLTKDCVDLRVRTVIINNLLNVLHHSLHRRRYLSAGTSAATAAAAATTIGLAITPHRALSIYLVATFQIKQNTQIKKEFSLSFFSVFSFLCLGRVLVLFI